MMVWQGEGQVQELSVAVQMQGHSEGCWTFVVVVVDLVMVTEMVLVVVMEMMKEW